jgi:hypothetical protein
LPRPRGPRGARNLKFTIYAPLVPKMHHTKFEKNWSCGYLEVKDIQMLIDTIYHVWPHPGGKTSTLRIMEFTILVEDFLLYITMHLVFLTYMYFQRRRFKKNWSILTLFALPQRPQGSRKPEIHNLCPPCSKNASYHI